MKEEDEILKKFGQNNPFAVPEDYFNKLTQEVMDKLPEKATDQIKRITPWSRVRPWLYMAAMFIGILLPLRYIINNTPEKTAYTSSINNDNELPSDEYIEEIMDHSMIDDYTLYQYLTDADPDITHN